jgi:hypothetical protein
LGEHKRPSSTGNSSLTCSHLHSRFRAPRKSPSSTPTQSGFFDPSLNTSGEFGGTTQYPQNPPSPNAQKPLYLCQPFVKAALVKGTFKTIVAPPKYVDVNEWVAINSQSRRVRTLSECGGLTKDPTIAPQSSISSTISITFTASSPSFARCRTVRRCRLPPSTWSSELVVPEHGH